MTESLLETVESDAPEQDSKDTHSGRAISERPEDVPEKFWDSETAQIRTDALVKSYRELERKLGSTVYREPPADPEDYNIEIGNEFLASDPEVNKRLHAAGFSEDQVQVVYDLAGEHLLPMISDLASVFEAEQQTERLVNHFGGQDKWNVTARQIDTWARSRLPTHVMDALATTYDGVLAMHQMMTNAEPGLLHKGEATNDGLSVDELKELMKDPRYWRDQNPAMVEKVRQGFRALYKE